MQGLLALIFIQVDDYFGIRCRPELVASLFELTTQGLKSIDFSVEGHHHGAILIAQGLLPGVQINDAEPPVAQANGMGLIDVHAGLIRSPVHETTHHRLHQVGTSERSVRQGYHAGNATHALRQLHD
jgi:hypothetical protein